MRNGDWAARSAVLQADLRELHPDLLGFQEVIRNAEHETASEILGSDYDVRHQAAAAGRRQLRRDRQPLAGRRLARGRPPAHAVFDEPIGGVRASDHFGLVADLEPA